MKQANPSLAWYNDLFVRRYLAHQTKIKFSQKIKALGLKVNA